MDQASLKSRMMQSSFWSAVSSGGNQVVGFIVFIVIARLVTRSQFGLVALAGILIDFMQIVSAGGIPDAVIQRPELTDDAADAAFWANFMSGVCFAGVAVLAAHWAADLFHTPGLVHVIDLLSVTFIIAPLGSIHSARMAREFGFKALAVRNFVSNLISGAVGVGMAVMGFGVDALCAQRVAFSIAITVLSWAGYRWVPKVRCSSALLWPLASYGLRTAGSQLLTQINWRLPELAAGFLFGPAAVATIRIASRCVDLLGQLTVVPFQQTALPVLARAQHNPLIGRAVYIDLSRLAAFAIFPVFAGAWVLAPIAVSYVFGHQWGSAGEVTQILCLVVVALQFNILLPSVLGAAGHPGKVLIWTICQLVVGVTLCVFGSQYGVTGLVSANVIRTYLMLPFGMLLLKKLTAIQPVDFLGSIAGPLASSLVMGGAVLILRNLLTAWMPPWAVLGCCVAVGFCTYAAISATFNPQLMRELVAMVRRRPRVGTV